MDGTNLLATLALTLVLVVPGCIEEKAAPAENLAPVAAEPVNATTLIAIKYQGNVGNRVCLTSATMCFPGGMGGPAGGGMLTGASQNPRTEAVNGAPQSVTLKVEWTAGPGGNAAFTILVSALNGTSGDGFGATGRELARKTGDSPLTIEVPDAAWKSGEGRLRIQLLPTSRTPNPSFVGVVAGQAFTVTGSYTTIMPAPATVSVAAGNATVS